MPRRSRHWSNRATAKTRARIEVSAGSTTARVHASAVASWWVAMSRRSSRSSRLDASSYSAPSRAGIERPPSPEPGSSRQERAPRRDEQARPTPSGWSATPRAGAPDRRRASPASAFGVRRGRRQVERLRVEVGDQGRRRAGGRRGDRRPVPRRRRPCGRLVAARPLLSSRRLLRCSSAGTRAGVARASRPGWSASGSAVRRSPARARATFRRKALDRPSVEASMTARRRVDRDAALVGPAAERAWVDAQEPAGGTQ